MRLRYRCEHGADDFDANTPQAAACGVFDLRLEIPTAKQWSRPAMLQLTKEYDLGNYKLRAIVREHDAKETGAKIVRQVMSPLLSRLPYSDLQTLNEHCQSGTSTAICSSAVSIRCVRTHFSRCKRS